MAPIWTTPGDFDTEVDGIPAWTPLSLRTLTERVAARADWFARRASGDVTRSRSTSRPLPT